MLVKTNRKGIISLERGKITHTGKIQQSQALILDSGNYSGVTVSAVVELLPFPIINLFSQMYLSELSSSWELYGGCQQECPSLSVKTYIFLLILANMVVTQLPCVYPDLI